MLPHTSQVLQAAVAGEHPRVLSSNFRLLLYMREPPSSDLILGVELVHNRTPKKVFVLMLHCAKGCNAFDVGIMWGNRDFSGDFLMFDFLIPIVCQ